MQTASTYTKWDRLYALLWVVKACCPIPRSSPFLVSGQRQKNSARDQELLHYPVSMVPYEASGPVTLREASTYLSGEVGPQCVLQTVCRHDRCCCVTLHTGNKLLPTCCRILYHHVVHVL